MLLRVARQTCLFVCPRKLTPTAHRAGAAELAGRGGGGHVDPGPGLRRGPLLARPPHARPPRRPPLRPRPRAAQGERCRRLQPPSARVQSRLISLRESSARNFLVSAAFLLRKNVK